MEFCLKAIKFLHNRSVKQRRELESDTATSPSAGDSSVTPSTKEDNNMEETNNEHPVTNDELQVTNDELPVTNDELPVTNENGNAPSPSSRNEEMGDKEGPQILT